MTRPRQVFRFVFDVILFAGVSLATAFLYLWGKPTKRGFFCDDKSLRYPLRESRVDTLTMLLVTSVSPIVIILALELCRPLNNNRLPASPNDKRKGPASPANTSGTNVAASNTNLCQLGQRLFQSGRHIAYFEFGLALTLLTTLLVKQMMGRLRPHFFAVCQPVLADGSSCEDAANRYRYILDYECRAMNVASEILRHYNSSFPSGHASAVFYGAVYLVLYLQTVLTDNASRLFKHLLQFLILLCALYVSLTRIADYWHFWSDVLAGAILGSVIAILVAYNVSVLFAKRFTRGPGGWVNVRVANSKLGASPATSSPKSMETPPVLPAYAFGTLPYMPHLYPAVTAPPQQVHHLAQAYHNYGYVP